nr:MAG TPA: hypothetical protein [Caudoviricetes sp.]
MVRIKKRLLCKTEKTKSTKLQNEKYRINKSKQRNEKYKGGAKNKSQPLFLSPNNRRLNAG